MCGINTTQSGMQVEIITDPLLILHTAIDQFRYTLSVLHQGDFKYNVVEQNLPGNIVCSNLKAPENVIEPTRNMELEKIRKLTQCKINKNQTTSPAPYGHISLTANYWLLV